MENGTIRTQRKFDIAVAMEPIWKGNVVYHESLLFVPDAKTGQLLPCRLLYPPIEILRVCSGDFSVEYQEGVDYRLENDQIIRLDGSKMPFFSYDEYYLKEPASIPIQSAACPGRYVRYEPNGTEVIKRQVAVTYRHEGVWPGVIPESQLHCLPITAKKLQEKLPLKILFFGDSFMEGCDASGRTGLPPFMPTLDMLVHSFLEQHYQHQRITIANTSVGGTTSRWGVEAVEQRVIAEAADLVIMRFGMNDSGVGIDPEEFIKNIHRIVTTCRQIHPQTEFLLLPPDLPNPDCLGWSRYQHIYWSLLQPYTQQTVGCGYVPFTHIHETIHNRKAYPSMTANCVNHPNDFMIRVYARAIVQSLIFL